MSGCIAAIAVALMLLKTGTWLALARFAASGTLNLAYVLATVLMVWSYVMAVRVAPTSRPPADRRVHVARVEDGQSAASTSVSGANDTLLATHGGEYDVEATRYCERCDMHKTALVHHCSTCHRCVFRLDHHCPWTNNCVGWDNKKYFLLFLLDTSMSCLLFNAMVSSLVWRGTSSDASATTQPSRDSDASLLQLTWALSLFVGVILAGYLLFHIWLLHRGMTTFEFLMGHRGELADTPLLYNARVYFGNNVSLWWLPVAPALDPTLGGSRKPLRQPPQQM